MIIINYYKGNGCFVGHFFCVDTQFSLDAARIERPQICRLLYFIILMQPFTNPRNFRKVLILPSTDININNVVIGLSMLSLQNVVCRPVLLYGRIGRPSRKTFIKDTEKRVQPAGCTRKSFYGAASFLGDSFFCQVRQQHGAKAAGHEIKAQVRGMHAVHSIFFTAVRPERAAV